MDDFNFRFDVFQLLCLWRDAAFMVSCKYTAKRNSSERIHYVTSFLMRTSDLFFPLVFFKATYCLI